jgi:hypothetical protein
MKNPDDGTFNRPRCPEAPPPPDFGQVPGRSTMIVRTPGKAPAPA